MAPIDLANRDYDERTMRRFKRKMVHTEGFYTCSPKKLKRTLEDNLLGDGMKDEDYKLYVSCVVEKGESWTWRRDDHDGDGDGDVDPQYKLFLERLTADETSYVLEIPIENESSVFKKYETEIGSDDELRKTEDISRRGEIKSGGDVGIILSKDKMDTPDNRRDILNEDKLGTPKDLSIIRERERNSVSEKDLKYAANEQNSLSQPEGEHLMENGAVDECYELILNGIEREGDSMDPVVEDGKWVKYDDDIECSSDAEMLVTENNAPLCDEGNYDPFVPSKSDDKLRKTWNVSNRKELKSGRDVESVSNKDKANTPNDCRDIRSEDKMGTPKNLRNIPESERCSVADKDLKAGPKGKNSSFNPEGKLIMEDGVIDEMFEMFLKSIRLEGDCVVLVGKDGKRVKYDNDGIDCSAENDAPLCDEGNYNPFVPSRSIDELRKTWEVSRRVELKSGRDVGSVSNKNKADTPNNCRDILREDKMGTPKNLSNILERERRSSVVYKDLKSAPKGKNSLSNPEGKHVMEVCVVDECYEIFLKNIELEGGSVVLVDEDGKRVKYDDHGECSSDSETLVTDNDAPLCEEGSFNVFVPSISDDELRKTVGVSRRKEIKSGRYVGNGSSKDKMETPNKFSDIMSEVKMGTQKRLSNILKRERISVAEKDLKADPKGKKYFSKPEGKHLMEDGVIDECYESFLKNIKWEGDSMVLVVEDRKRLKYDAAADDDIESSSDSEVQVDDAPFCGGGTNNQFLSSRAFDASMEGDDLHCLGDPNESKHSQFRNKLMSILRRPFDQNEYEELLREVNDRKPVEGRRNLRGGIKSFSADKFNKSYLDHYSDLKKKIKAALFDRRKVLNLLRGFFYWLQNLSHEGAFCPWMDSSCLAVVPGNH